MPYTQIIIGTAFIVGTIFVIAWAVRTMGTQCAFCDGRLITLSRMPEAEKNSCHMIRPTTKNVKKRVLLGFL